MVEIFYDGIEPKRESYRALRDGHLPFPPREDGYPRVLLLGVPGAGKTTLVRQFIGSHPKRDRFPSTSVNRTTTCETEVIAGVPDYAAAVTFMSEEETDFEVRQSVTGKIKRLLEPMGKPRFGFLTSDLDGEDVYFSERQIGAGVFSTLSVGLPIEADVVETSDGRRQARSIRRL